MKNRLCWLGCMAFALMGTAPGANADPSLAGGLYHSLAVDSTGQVLSWGDDGSGQLGSGRATTVLTPAVVSGLPAGTVRSLAAGVFHSMALLEDGTVLAWGNNAEGVLGDGSTQSHASPLPVLGLPPLRSLHSGERHAVGIDTQGQLWSWGLNHKGQLGHSAHAYQATLAQRVSLADAVVAVRGGGAHTLALTAVGHVWAWGDNQRGQIASASLPSSVQAVRIAFPTAAPAIVAIEAAGDQSYALDGEGGVWAWGDNRYGQLGDDSATQRATPQRVAGLPPISTLAAGKAGAAAIARDGSVWTWGGYDIRSAPSRLPSVQGVARGLYQGEYHLMILRDDGSLVGTGGNFSGQLGDGTTASPNSTTLISPLGIGSAVVQAATGARHSLALDTSGQLWSWGDDLSGQTGSSTETTRSVPAVVALEGPVAQVAAGDGHSLALLRDGGVLGWGDNFGGAVGVATVGVRTAPERLPGLTNIQQISAAKASSAALDRAGALWVWGDNSNGQLARPSPEATVLLPTRAENVPALTNIALGAGHALGLGTDGQVWAWGLNREGQLGSGDVSDRPTPPSAVVGLSQIVALAAGEAHSLALDREGQVWAWGRNTYAQVNPSDRMSVPLPTLVTGLPRISAIAAGRGSSLALDTQGRIWAWGLNQFGELGQGSTGFTLNPTVSDGVGYARLSAAPWHTMASRSDGVTWAFGWNESGQLGDGGFVQQPLAVGVVNPALTGFLDLAPEDSNLAIPDTKNPPFFARTHKQGSNRRLVLSAGIPIAAPPATRLGSRAGAARYSVFVVALVRAGGGVSSAPLGIFQKTPSASWQPFVGGPLQAYLSDVSQNSSDSILVDILNNDDISLLAGTQFIIGYGQSDQEMLAAGRYRMVYEVTP